VFRADGDQHSGIDVISRRSEATLADGFFQKVITIVKLVFVAAVRKVEIAKRFPRAFLARLFHSFSPADWCSLLSFHPLSAGVVSPICSCHLDTGSCEVRMSERVW
jgi:hypothetical protein